MLTTNQGIRLLWFKQRISSLLDRNQDANAIELAVQNNLLCPGTAFIAWDEHEQVAIAGKEIYQPCLEVPQPGASLSQTVACASPVRGLTRHFLTAGKRASMSRGGSAASFYGSCLSEAGAIDYSIGLGLLQSPGGRRFWEALQAWARASQSPLEAGSRKNALKKLTADLLRQGTDLDQCRQICRRFIQEHVIIAALDKRVQRMADELKSAPDESSLCRAICAQFRTELEGSEAYRLREMLAAI